MPNPYDNLEEHAKDLLRVALQPFFRELQGTPTWRLELAIRQALPALIWNNRRYAKALTRLIEGLGTNATKVLTEAMKRAAGEVVTGAPRLGAEVGELAKAYSGERAVAIGAGIDESTRQGIRSLVTDAAGRYALQPSPKYLRQLAKEIQPKIGLTPKQVAYVQRVRNAAAARGASPEALVAIEKRLTEQGIRFRANAIAREGLVETISGGRQRAWERAEELGELPAGVRKRARTQGDDRVRPLHSVQAGLPPIPLRALFQIFQKMSPPFARGCRCWSTLVQVARDAFTSSPPPQDVAPVGPTREARIQAIAQKIEAKGAFAPLRQIDRLKAIFPEAGLAVEANVTAQAAVEVQSLQGLGVQEIQAPAPRQNQAG